MGLDKGVYMVVVYNNINHGSHELGFCYGSLGAIAFSCWGQDMQVHMAVSIKQRSFLWMSLCNKSQLFEAHITATDFVETPIFGVAIDRNDGSDGSWAADSLLFVGLWRFV